MRSGLQIVMVFAMVMTWVLAVRAAEPLHWNAADRAERVSRLIPGRKIPTLNPRTLFADRTMEQVAAWKKTHPDYDPAAAYAGHVKAEPTDESLLADFPRHIAPLARVRQGKPQFPGAADQALYRYCPFCQSQAMTLRHDPQNPYHATTGCCATELYGREADYPEGYTLKATETVVFNHWGDTKVEAPCVVYSDKDGVVWELFLKTLFDQRRWLDVGGDRIAKFADEFKKTGDPLYAHKIAVLLDAVADTYYGLPLVFRNEVKEISRADWEASPRPNIFAVGPLGPWNRRMPNFNRGWLNMAREHIWAEPFAITRHHPAFKMVSEKKYGDPEALDRKIREKLMRELSLMFQSVFAQKLLTNYQDAIYVNMILMGVLAEDDLLTRLFVPAHEVTLYNHSYRDGMNGEGAPNYMAMPGSYFLPYLIRPDGWLRFHPAFAEDHPFHAVANEQWKKMTTARGMSIEFGDQHIHAWHPWLKDGTLHGQDKEPMDRLGSRNWAGYGVGILRIGAPGRRLELSLNYTRATLHNSQDALSLEAWVDGVPVMRRGGYSAWWMNLALPQDRPEFKALAAMDYPNRIVEASKKDGFASWSWAYAHSPLCQNTAMVDGDGAGAGWADNRGYGEVITYKGGEAAGQPGSSFQILDVRDHYAWQQVGKDVPQFRRTLIGVETPDGRAYALDLFKMLGGREHSLFNSAWAHRAEATLPATEKTVEDLEAALPGGGPGRGTDRSYFRQVKKADLLAPAGAQWSVTWRTDFAAYAPRRADGSFVRPLPEDEGKVRLRLIGLDGKPGPTELLSARGPWLAVIRQPLPGGITTNGVVAFEGARDFLIERRRAAENAPALESLFVHVIEGFREGKTAHIAAVERLEAKSLAGAPRDTVALRVRLQDGTTDVVLFQSEPGSVRLPDGLETDARYALLRRDPAGKLTQIEASRGTFIRDGNLRHDLGGDMTGTIVDIIGDLTGTRQESALILDAPKPWPEGDALKGRQLLVTFKSTLRADAAEGYRIEKATNLPDGRVRLDLMDHVPFITSWHDVFDLPEGAPGVLRTTRPLSKHANSPWYRGMSVWFPEKGRHYAIEGINPLGGGHGGEKVTLVGAPDLALDGIKPGDWFVVYGIRPGLKVNVAGQWRWSAPERD